MSRLIRLLKKYFLELLSLVVGFLVASKVIPYINGLHLQDDWAVVLTNPTIVTTACILLMLGTLTCLWGIIDCFRSKDYSFINDRFAYYTISHRLYSLYEETVSQNKDILGEEIEPKWQPDDKSRANVHIWKEVTISLKLSKAEREEYCDLYDKAARKLGKYKNERLAYGHAPFIILEHYFYYSIIKLFKDLDKVIDPYFRKKTKISLDEISSKYKGDLSFSEHLKRCVFANTSDLSQTGGHLNRINDPILFRDDTVKAEKFIQKHDPKRIDILTDNCGVELYSDIKLALFLIRNYKVMVVFHARVLPQFVSDTIKSKYGDDFDALFKLLPEEDTMQKEFLEAQKENKIVVKSSLYWNLPVSYHESCRQFRKHVGDSDLVIVKGDLNYRKLLGDKERHIGVYALRTRQLGYPVLSLRAIKSSLLDGISFEEKRLVLNNLGGLNGQYGVIQFYNPSVMVRLRRLKSRLGDLFRRLKSRLGVLS